MAIGINSRYWGVTWKGDAGINTAFNYHKNVYNAFLTANKLKTLINDSDFRNKTVMAHSLETWSCAPPLKTTSSSLANIAC